MEERLTTLELKMMELEHTVAELNEVVTEQYRTIDLLKQNNKQLQLRINALAEPDTSDIRNEPPPPHY